jgi:para-aminobenzoate synthetase component 1
VRVAELEYSSDTPARFGALADKPWSVLLDSGRELASGGRYDIYAADPVTEVRSRTQSRISERDPLAILREALDPPSPPDPAFPFPGGAIGYFAYDLGRRFERWPALAERDIDMPEMAVGLYDWAVVVDRAEERCWLIGQGRDDKTFAVWDELRKELIGGTRKPRPRLEVLTRVRSNLDREAYNRAFAKIKAHIRAGDCYQVNLTQRFSAEVRGSAWNAYEHLRVTNPAPFSAYLNTPFGQILSSSPERFLRLRDGHVLTQPIKGTRPRGATARQDEVLVSELKASRKDRAENVMIVDLLRNDLGKNCAPGTIRATKLFDVETFTKVHHLVSTVEGVPAPGRHATDLLRGCFPGGSITGAPKLRAIQIIEACEPERRSVYCGAIGYIGFDGAMDTNIAIRTLVQCKDRLYAWAGGGIVADSDVDAEYQESLDKASGLLAVFDDLGISEAS